MGHTSAPRALRFLSPTSSWTPGRTQLSDFHQSNSDTSLSLSRYIVNCLSIVSAPLSYWSRYVFFLLFCKNSVWARYQPFAGFPYWNYSPPLCHLSAYLVPGAPGWWDILSPGVFKFCWRRLSTLPGYKYVFLHFLTSVVVSFTSYVVLDRSPVLLLSMQGVTFPNINLPSNHLPAFIAC